MHLAGVSIIAAMLLVGNCSAFATDRATEDLLRPYAGGQLVDALEKFKDVLRKGNETLHIPVLDPLNVKHTDVNLEEKGLFSVVGTLDDIREAGLSNYKVNRGDLTLVGLLVNVSLTWPQIMIMSKYDLNGTLGEDMSFFGKGQISLVVRDMTATVDLKLSIRNEKIQATSLVFHVHLKEFDCKITGLYNDEDMSKTVSDVITDIVPGLIDDYQKQVSEYASPLIMDLLNGILKTLSLKDIIGMIGG